MGMSTMVATTLMTRATEDARATGAGRPRPLTYEERIFETLSATTPGRITRKAGMQATNAGRMTLTATKAAGMRASETSRVTSTVKRQTIGVISSALRRSAPAILGKKTVATESGTKKVSSARLTAMLYNPI